MIRISVWHRDLSDSYLRQVTQLGADCIDFGNADAFPGVREPFSKTFDDQQFALELLEKKHVLVAPGSSFNVPYRNHFRMTTLPLPDVIREVFDRIEVVMDSLDLE